MNDQINVAVFASGGGSNFQALLDKKNEGLLHVNFALMVGNNSKALSFRRAKEYNIPTLHISPSHYKDEEEYIERLTDELEFRNIDLIVLAGYMKKIPLPIVKKFENRIMNIHPGILPGFGGIGMYGINVHESVLEYGAKISGITVHFVDGVYDHGPVILQKTVAVMDDDTPEILSKRVLILEHENYWRAIEAFAQKRIHVEGRRVLGTI